MTKHCDDYIDDESQPQCLRRFLRYNRWPAFWQYRAHKLGVKEPVLFAQYGKKRVRVVMASRLGDVGITEDLSAAKGYSLRVPVCALSRFSDS